MKHLTSFYSTHQHHDAHESQPYLLNGFFAVHDVVACADVDGTIILFFFAHDQNKVVLRQLVVSNFLV